MLETSRRSGHTSESWQPAPDLIAGVGQHQRERLLLVALGLVVLIASSLPYAYAYLTQPPDRVFSGIVFNVPDNAQYLSWARDHRTGLLVSNRMTPEPNPPLLFNLLWLVVAQLSVLTSLPITVLFHIVRIVAGASALLLLYPFCRVFTHSAAERLAAYLMIMVGAGLGWIWVIDKYAGKLADIRFPLDLYVAEPNLFFNMLAFPHFVIATVLIVSIFWCYLEALKHHSWYYAIGAALLGLVLTLQHAYDLLIIGLVPAGTLALVALRDRRLPWFGIQALFLIGIIATPPAAYFTLLTSRDPLWREILDQFSNAGVFTPPLAHLFILLGLPLVLVTAGVIASLIALARSQASRLATVQAAFLAASTTDLFLWSWFVIGLLLLYIPTDFQIHMLNTWQIPVAILAARVVYRQILPQVQQRQARLRRAIPLMLVLLVIPTNLYLVAWRMLELGRHEAPYYLTRDTDTALHWLNQNSDRQSVVLSGLQVGQMIPVRTDARTFLGHWAQTVDFYAKREQVQQFFDAHTPETQREGLIKRFGITYIVYGSEERGLGDYDIQHSALLEPAFSSGEVTIYRVRLVAPSIEAIPTP